MSENQYILGIGLTTETSTQLTNVLDRLGIVHTKYVPWRERMGNRKTNTHAAVPFMLTDEDLSLIKLSVNHPKPVIFLSTKRK